MYFNGTKCGSLLVCCILSLSLAAKDVKSAGHSNGLAKPLCFIENKGQVADQNNRPRKDIQYSLATPGMVLYIGNGQLHYQFKKGDIKSANPEMVTTYRMDVTLTGANPNAEVIPSDKQSYYENYYIGKNGTDGFTAGAWSRIVYKDVYPNIDWVLYVKDGNVEYDFNVRPGGNVKDIKLTYGGATSLTVTNDGGITAVTPMGTVHENSPVAFEQQTGRAVPSSFKVKNNVVTFETGEYKGGITIDPTLQWSTYLGGTNLDVATSIVEDALGFSYVGGHTSSNGLATVGAFMGIYQGGAFDAFLAKYNAAGVIQFTTYVGGTGTDQGTCVAIESGGSGIYLGGSTTSTPAVGLLSTVGAYRTVNGGGNDGFLIKFNNTGARQWCTFFGGPGNDNITSVAVDGFNNVYITGGTASTTNIASPGAYQIARNGSTDAFLAKFNSVGSIQWSTYYGGSSQETGYGVACDVTGNAYITGQTNSITTMASAGAFQSVLSGTNDAFVASFSTAGIRTWGTYFGGTGSEAANAIALDPVTGNIAIVGNTTSPNVIASAGAVQATIGGGVQDAFVAYFDATGARKWSTYYGGSALDYGQAVCFDQNSNVIAAGATFSNNNIATPGASQPANGGDYDAYMVKINSLGQRLWGTFFGGTFYDYANGVAVDANGQTMIAGYTTSLGLYGAGGISTAGAAQVAYAGGSYDGFVAKFDADLYVTINQPFTDTMVCAGGTLQVFYSVLPAPQTFTAGNTFTVQLSNAIGSFASPVNIGTVTAVSSGTISCVIPGGTPLGSGYRIRIVATNPAYVSPDEFYNINVLSSIGGTTASSNSPACVGNTIFLHDTATYSILTYSWTGPLGYTSTLQNPTVGPVTLGSAGVYTVTTVHNGCPASSATVAVAVSNFTPPTPIVSANSVCAGGAIILHADPDTTASPLTYYWVGPNGFTSTRQDDTIFVSTALNAGFYFVMDTLNGCQSAQGFALVNVNPVHPVSISISANSPWVPGTAGDTICSGDLVNFNAFPINGGSTPTFQWMKGPSTPVVGAVSNSWSTNSLLDGAQVYCILHSSVDCPSPANATSNVIHMNVISHSPTVYISASPGLFVPSGSSITFNSWVYDAGIAPAYQWTKNGVNIPGATNSTYTIASVTRKDTIRLVVMSTMNCSATPFGTSNALVIATNVGVTNIAAAFENVGLFPNPNNGSFTLQGTLENNGNSSLDVSVTNMVGQSVYKGTTTLIGNELHETIDLNNIPSGVYLLQVTRDGESKIFRFAVER